MKKRILSLTLTLLIALSCFSPAVFAEDEEIFPDNSVAEMEEELGAGESSFTEDVISPCSEDGDEELGVGEVEIPEDAESLTMVDDDELGAGEETEIFPDNSDSDSDGDEELGAAWEDEESLEEGEASEGYSEDDGGADAGEEDLGGSSPKVSLSASAITLTKGGSSKVNVSFSGASGSLYMQYKISNTSVCSASWGKWSGKTVPITITGKSKGQTYVYVYLKRSLTNTTLASARIYVEVADNAKVTASLSSVSVYVGSAKSVSFSYSGFSGNAYLQYSTTNSTAYTCKWGSWNGGKVPLTITGKSRGSGTVTVYLKSRTTGITLAKTSISINILSNAKVTLSASSVCMTKGSSTQIKATYSNYSGSVYMQYGTTNSSVFTAKWGSWSGSTCPLTVTGSAVGKATLYVYLKDATTKATLATATCSVQVLDNARVTASPSSTSVTVGESASVKFTASGITGACYLQCSSNSYYVNCNWGSWSGSTVPLTITGKNTGTTTIYVYLLNAAKVKVASTSITVTVNAAKTPYLKASTTSVSLKAGNATSVSISVYDASGTFYLQYGTTNDTNYTCAWGSWYGNTNSLTITGKSAGSGTVTVYLKQSSSNTTLAKISISVKVTASGSTLSNLSYKYENFGKAASLSICQYMFGNTAYAKSVYAAKMGAGGNCFGMATTSGMFYTSGNGVNPSSFNSSKSAISELVKSDYNNSWSLTAEQFAMAMQLTQVSYRWNPTYVSGSTLSSLVQTVSSQNAQGYPVMVCISGVYGGGNCGHAVIAYGVETVSSTRQRLLIYDSNYPLETRYLYLNKNSSGTYISWSYELFKDGTTWGTGYANESISYTTYSNYYSLWSNRGNLNVSSMNLLISNSKNFTVYDVNDAVVATVTDGQLSTENENIKEIPVASVAKDGSVDSNYYLFVPVTLYTVVNDDTEIDEFELGITNNELGVMVKTTADTVTLCADDSCNITSTLLPNGKDEDYEITFNSSRDGDYESYTMSGVGEDDVVSAMMNDGDLELCNMEDVELSAGAANDADAAEYTIQVTCGDNGQILCDETGVVKAGEDRTFTIVPDSGYVVESVKVDNENVGAVTSYTFQNIQSNHTIEATFKKDPDAPVYQLGDVNGDGKVNSSDLTALARHVAKIETITDADLLAAADTNQSGDVNASDLTHLARFVAKIISSL